MKKITASMLGMMLSSFIGSAFSSPYIGANLGYTNNNFLFHADSTTSTVSGEGANIGLFLGYQQKIANHFYLASEANVNDYNVNATYNHAQSYTINRDYKQYSSYGIDILPTVSLNPMVKLFALGGWQMGQFKFQNLFNNIGYSEQKNLNAYDLGLGAEFLLNKSLVLRLSFRHIDYASTTLSGGGLSQKVSPITNQFNLGLLYYFK